MMDKAFLGRNHLVTPHLGEFKVLFKPGKQEARILTNSRKKTITKRAEIIQKYSQKHGCLILLKGPIDIIASPHEWKYNFTGNEGMTKGGTGDVLAGLVAALACKNDLFLAACAGAFINGLAGDRLKKKVEIYFNASDLGDEIPRVLKSLIF
jgi:NAD(P)H-hydrate epimerase